MSCRFEKHGSSSSGNDHHQHEHSHEHSHDHGSGHSHSHDQGAAPIAPKLTSSQKYSATKYDGWTQADIEHGHRHEQIDTAGKFVERPLPVYDNRDWDERAFTVGIGG